jgi:predicted MFS family arabinose efflux permease
MNDATTEISRGRSIYSVGLLMVVGCFYYLDRNVLNILIEPIKQDLGVSDTAMGVLTGAAFAVFYVVAGIPIARWTDRGNRRDIIALAAAAWSTMTVACGLALNFGQLALARVGVAVGEAGATPAIHSLLSDLFPAKQRGRAIGAFNTGLSIGVCLGILAGGYLAETYGWRLAFVIVGLPGVLLAIAIRFTIPEPRRGLADGAAVVEASPSPKPTSMANVLRFLLQFRSIRFMLVAAIFHSIVAAANTTWAAAFLMRSHDVGLAKVGLWLGVSMGIGLLLGNVVTAYLVDRVGARDPRWYMWIPAMAHALTFVFAGIFLLTDNFTIAVAAFLPYIAASATWATPTTVMLMGVARPEMRAFASLLFSILNYLVGIGLGPIIGGVLSDWLAPTFAEESLRYALLIVNGLALFSLVFFSLAGITAREDLAAAQAIAATDPGRAIDQVVET